MCQRVQSLACFALRQVAAGIRWCRHSEHVDGPSVRYERMAIVSPQALLIGRYLSGLELWFQSKL